MEQQPLIAGIPPGGFQDVHEVRILICYLLDAIKQPLTRDQINEVFQQDQLMNYFVFAEAMAELTDSKHMEIVNSEEGQLCRLTQLGQDAASMLQSSLPRSVRDRVVTAAVALLARIRLERENEFQIEPYRNGYNVTLTIHDQDLDLLKLILFVPDKLQAEIVKEQFMKDPAGFYTKVIQSLTQNQ